MNIDTFYDENIPPSSTDENIPPSSTDENIPPSSTEENILATSSTDENIPRSSTEDNIPPSSIDENILAPSSSITTDNQRKIKHLVISGGSIWGLSAFGIIYEAISCGFLNTDDIVSIYGTSIGAIVGLTISLKIDHNIIKDFLINRPCEILYKKSMCSVLEVFDRKGLIQHSFFMDFFSPLFKSVDLEMNLTMKQLYDYNGIEFHIYVTELNSFKLVDISYKTHPDWEVLEAISASCSIPLLFSPLIKDNNCYIDGGFFLNYPISKCIENVENRDEIFGILLGGDYTINSSINSESNIFDLLNVLLNRIINNIDYFSIKKTLNAPYEIHYYLRETTLDFCFQVLHNKEDRKYLIYNGINQFKDKFKEWFPIH
jgi:predicted acylesterase/phospholipase RssA